MDQLLREGAERGINVEMVYPAVTQETLHPQPEAPSIDVASLPNRFVAIVEGAPSVVASMGEQIAETVREELKQLCEFAIDTVFPHVAQRDALVHMAKRQVEASLEVFWAMEPFDDEAAFQEKQRVAERRLAAVKNNRFYGSHAQNGLICTVCGERDALHSEPFSEQDSIGEMKRKLATLWNSRHKAFKDGELLCALCLGKRASRKFFRKKRKAPHAFCRFESTQTVAGKHKYYAILMMDGDDMGQWFSGDLKSKQKRLSGFDEATSHLEHYQEVSRRLSRFAKKVVPDLVKKYGSTRNKQLHSELVYAGGDDVLAFVPVDRVLPLAQELREAFSDPTRGLDEGATASIGIVIAHAKDPLYSMLDHVRESEKMAKSYEHPDGKKKDAFALAYLARSGELRQVVLPWNLDQEKTTVSQLERLMNLFRKDVSSTFVYTFAQTFLPLVDIKGSLRKKADAINKIAVFQNEKEHLNDLLLKIELQRLLQRALKESGRHHDVSMLADDLLRLHRDSDSTFQFIQLLEIVRNLGGIIHGSTSTETG